MNFQKWSELLSVRIHSGDENKGMTGLEHNRKAVYRSLLILVSEVYFHIQIEIFI